MVILEAIGWGLVEGGYEPGYNLWFLFLLFHSVDT